MQRLMSMAGRLNMTGRRWAAVAAGVVVVVALLLWTLWAGGTRSGGTPYPPGPVPGTVTSPGASAPGAAASARPATSVRPGVTGGTDAAAQAAGGFLNELGAIDPRLVTDQDRALAAGRATCQDLAAHRPDETVIAAVTQRFHIGGATVDRTTAALIVDAAHSHLCP